MTAVTLKFTGDLRLQMGVDRMGFEFAGGTLGELLETLFLRHDLRELLLDQAGNIKPYSRVVINGRFSYLVGDMNAPVQECDLVVLIHPYIVAL